LTFEHPPITVAKPAVETLQFRQFPFCAFFPGEGMFLCFQRNPSKVSFSQPRVRLLVEELEPRLTMSLLMGDLGGADARGGGLPPPAIRLDLVALHELGHSLGLAHDDTNAVSIMDPYYNKNYDLGDFANDPAVAKLLDIYADVNASGWNDAHDFDDGATDGDIDLTYSFMGGGLRMDGGKPVYSTAIPVEWQSIITAQLDRWEAVSAGKLDFVPHDEIGSNAFNVLGSAQNDSRFGDIRIGSHYFDGAGKVLAHAYYPPPNGSTAAGDAHFDNSEKWVLSDGITPLAKSTSSSSSTSGSSAGSSSSRNLRGSNLADLETAFAIQQIWLADSNASTVAISSATLSETEDSPVPGLLLVSTAEFHPLLQTVKDEPITRPATKAVAPLDPAQWHDLAFDDYYAEPLADGANLGL
jgi:hypothetical protein